jgi:aryl-alcohol dehydrogenase-like predicted oxidoreductase
MGRSRREFLKIFGAGAIGAPLLGRGWSPPWSEDMSTRPIPASDEEIPVIGMGTWQTFDVGESEPERAPLRTVLRAFFEAGGRVIDSSPMYGRSEEVVGDLLAELDLLDPAFLATKVWTSGRDDGIRQMEESFRKMRTRTMDLMQVHNLVDWRTQLDTLGAWKREGRVRYVGVTHYRLGAFDELERIIRGESIDFVQLPYSIAVREAEARVLPAAADNDVAVLVMRPFEGGSLFSRVRGRRLPDWAVEFDCESWAQFFLKFILGHPAVTCPIPATSDPDHMRDNVRAGYGRLPDEAMRRRMVEELDL